MNFKLVTSLNKRLFEHKAQQLITSAIKNNYPLDIYHENSYENIELEFPKGLSSIVHAVLNSTTEYTIWCDGDAYFVNKLDKQFWDFVSQYNVSCIYRDSPHIESGFVVYKNNNHVKKLMREYMGYYLTGDVWKYPRWCDGSVLTYLLKDEKIGKFKNIDYNKKDTSDFDISYYFNHIKDPFKEVRNKE